MARRSILGAMDERAFESAVDGSTPRTRRHVRSTTLILLATLIALGVWAPRVRPEPVYVHAQANVPDPVAPTGVLAEVYDLALPATVRIEARCVGDPRGRALGVGTGFYVSPDGDVLTAYHVVEGGSATCEVEYVGVEVDGDVVRLRLEAFDAYFDLAWLSSDVDVEVPFLSFAARDPTPGTDVVAIGNSRGDFLAPRAGRITRLGVRANRADFADDTIEMTAALAPGDSGGPVLDVAGRVVGVVSYISYTPGSMQSDGYVPPFLRGLTLPSEYASYAVPVSETSDLVGSLRAGERRDVPVIGFSWQPGFDYDPSASTWEFGRRPGPVVVQVAPGGPADRAGLRSYAERPVYGANGALLGVERSGDVIVAVDGEATPTFYDLLAAVREKSVGDTVALTVQRGRTTVRIELTLGAKRDVFASPR